MKNYNFHGVGSELGGGGVERIWRRCGGGVEELMRCTHFDAKA